MYVLGIETAGERGGVALLAPEGEYEVVFHAGRKHLELLPQAVQAVLASAGVKQEEMGLIAVDVGPGSFTGLRIGIAFAKAMAQTLALPLVGVRQTEVLGAQAKAWWPGRVAVWIHDRREFLYHAWVSGVKVGKESVLTVDKAIKKLRGREDVLVVGSGALRFQELVRKETPTALVAGESLAYPDPVTLAKQGLARFEAQGPDKLLALEPLYIQPPLANAKEA